MVLGAVALANYQRKANDDFQVARQEYERSKRIVTAEAATQSRQTGDRSYREEWRSERDLEAQQDMARWAMLMFFASAASVVVTIVGLLLIWRTLHHTRRAADYARAMVDETRVSSQSAALMANVMVGTEIPVIQVRPIGIVLHGSDQPVPENGAYNSAWTALRHRRTRSFP